MLFFPSWSLNSLFEGISFINSSLNLFLDFYLEALEFINKIDIFPTLDLPLFAILLFTTLVIYKKKAVALFLLCLSPKVLFHQERVYTFKQIINLGPKEEIVKRIKNKTEFITKGVHLKNEVFRAKKKPSHLGGLHFKVFELNNYFTFISEMSFSKVFSSRIAYIRLLLICSFDL